MSPDPLDPLLATPQKRRRGRAPNPSVPPVIPPLGALAPPPAPLPPEDQDEVFSTAGGYVPTPSDILVYRRLLEERLRRSIEALNLYEPLPIQELFHASAAHIRILRGSNRAGKTLSTAIELARAVTGRDPHGKYPERDGRAYIIGKDEKHLGEVIYRKLFRPGAFRMIRDEVTGIWRAYRPWVLKDALREKESKPAPPMIPRRYIKSITWKSKGDNIPEKVTLINGWELDFWSSLSKPPRGSDLDVVWLDEEIIDSDWVPEMLARLLDREGCLFWGATPQTGSDRLYELHQRCEDEMMAWKDAGCPEEGPLVPTAREFLILLKDNPHLTEKAKAEFAKGLTAADAAVRLDGDFAIEASKVWPEYNVKIHDVPYFGIPEDWTRYAIIDPGRQVCAVLFAAVPPPWTRFPVGADAHGEDVWISTAEHRWAFLYDELYIPACSATLFGEKMAMKCQNQVFQNFIIDNHGSRLVDIGSGKSVEEQYAAALKENGVECVATKSNFTWASDDVTGGVEAVRTLLHTQSHGRPTLITVGVRDKLPNFKYEIERYRYKRTNGMVTDKPEDKGRVHLMANLRYLALFDPRYVAPPAPVKRDNSAFAVFKRKQAKAKKAKGGGGVSFGPNRG